MSKFSLSLLLLIGYCLTAKAQVNFGVKAGANINVLKFREVEDHSATVSFHAGLLAELTVTPGFFIRPELQYSVKGERSPVVGANGQGNLYLKYITVPILAGIPFAKKFAFLIGPEFGFMTKATSNFSGNKSDVTDYYQHFDWGIDLGATYKVTPQFGVEVRYNYGFYGLIKGITTDQNGEYTGSNKDGANRVVQAGLFYLFK